MMNFIIGFILLSLGTFLGFMLASLFAINS